MLCMSMCYVSDYEQVIGDVQIMKLFNGHNSHMH